MPFLQTSNDPLLVSLAEGSAAAAFLQLSVVEPGEGSAKILVSSPEAIAAVRLWLASTPIALRAASITGSFALH